MKLSRLRGSQLKVYLALVALRDADDCCRAPLRIVSLQAGMPRATCITALRRLQHVHELIVFLDPGWAVDTEPLRRLLRSQPAGRSRRPATQMDTNRPEESAFGLQPYGFSAN